MQKCLKTTLKIIIFYILFLIINNAKLVSNISPFAFAFLFAFTYIFSNSYYVLPAYFLSVVTCEFNFTGFAISFSCTAFCLLNMVLSKRVKQPYRLIFLIFLVLISQLPEILLKNAFTHLLIPSVINVFLGFILLYLNIIILNAVQSRGLQTKLTIDENIGLFSLLLPIFLGFYNVKIFDISLHTLIISLGILVVANIKNGTYALALSIVAGLGVAFSIGEIQPMAIYCCLAISIVACGRINKFLPALVIVIVDFILGHYFNVYNVYNVQTFLSVAIASLIFLIIPSKIYNRLYEYFMNEKVCFSNSYLVDQNKLFVKKKLDKINQIFRQMNDIYKKMVIGKMDKQEVSIVLTDDVVLKTCKDCERKNICNRDGDLKIKSQLQRVVDNGIEKGRVSLVDVPSGLSMCNKINTLISNVNQNIIQYHQYEGLVAREDRNKIVVGNQFLGVAGILENLVKIISKCKRVSQKFEKQLVDEFLFNNIIVRECLITEDENGFDRAVIIIKNVKYKIEDIISVTDSFFKTRTKYVDSVFAEISGWKVITIAKAPKLKLMFGCASIGKNGKKINGDSFSYVSLGDNKYLLGLSDGKGNGEMANETSSLSIGLIEDYYMAGFSSDIIMQSVNKIFAFNNNENFSAVDLCIIDTQTGGVDFIKVGSSPSAIKHKDKVEILESESLPLGIMENSKQTLIRKCISSGDMVVLVSDGVFDGFEDVDTFAGFVNNNNLINVQMFAENILEEAVTRYDGVVKDDMTVLAVRAIFDR